MVRPIPRFSGILRYTSSNVLLSDKTPKKEKTCSTGVTKKHCLTPEHSTTLVVVPSSTSESSVRDDYRSQGGTPRVENDVLLLEPVLQLVTGILPVTRLRLGLGEGRFGVLIG